jgi:putative transcriptional regulator
MGFVIGGPATSDPAEFLFTHMNIHTFRRASQPWIGAFACPRPVRTGPYTLDNAKNEQANLSEADKRSLKRLLPIFVSRYRIKELIPIMSTPIKKTSKRPAAEHTAAGSRLIRSVKQAIAWADGENVPVRVTMVQVHRAPAIDVRSLRQKLGLSQSQFAARFGFTPATVRNWEQGRTQPDGPARTLLAVIAHHPEAVEDALRKAS